MYNKELIIESMNVLKKQVQYSKYSNNEKKVLTLLIDKIEVYYLRKLSITNSNKYMQLNSWVVDLLIEIDNVIKKQSDVFHFVSIVNKQINDSEIEDFIKKYRYLVKN